MKGIVKGNRYYSDRTDQHYFIKYHGFGISESIMDSLPDYVEWIIFRYYGKRERAYYGIKRSKVRQVGSIFYDGDDKQFVINTDDMEKVVK